MWIYIYCSPGGALDSHQNATHHCLVAGVLPVQQNMTWLEFIFPSKDAQVKCTCYHNMYRCIYISDLISNNSWRSIFPIMGKGQTCVKNPTNHVVDKNQNHLRYVPLHTLSSTWNRNSTGYGRWSSALGRKTIPKFSCFPHLSTSLHIFPHLSTSFHIFPTSFHIFPQCHQNLRPLSWSFHVLWFAATMSVSCHQMEAAWHRASRRARLARRSTRLAMRSMAAVQRFRRLIFWDLERIHQWVNDD